MRKIIEQYLYTALLAIIILTLVLAVNAHAEGRELPQHHGAQHAFMVRVFFPYLAAYSDPSSLRDDGDMKNTQTLNLYSGMKVWDRSQADFKLELLKGAAVGMAPDLEGVDQWRWRPPKFAQYQFPCRACMPALLMARLRRNG